jgi:nicotinate-nucleotide adenylyltransferase
VLGGTFDPIHHAHLFTAESVAHAFQLNRVLLVPAHHSPLKTGAPASASDRVAMARLAAQRNSLLEVSTVDVDRSPPSYTVDTIRLLAEQHAGAELFLIMGVDALQDFLDWREPERLLDLCQMIVVSRPGRELAIPAELAERLRERATRILLHPMPLLDVSSTDLRRRFARGLPVRYLLPDAVERYVRQRGLYGAA